MLRHSRCCLQPMLRALLRQTAKEGASDVFYRLLQACTVLSVTREALWRKGLAFQVCQGQSRVA